MQKDGGLETLGFVIASNYEKIFHRKAKIVGVSIKMCIFAHD